jgi:hypothetical protein
MTSLQRTDSVQVECVHAVQLMEDLAKSFGLPGEGKRNSLVIVQYEPPEAS